MGVSSDRFLLIDFGDGALRSASIIKNLTHPKRGDPAKVNRRVVMGTLSSS
jgi:hypothetical protein